MAEYFIVEQRKDGRGGHRPFGVYGAKEAGGTVQMGGKEIKITTDGRWNIPKEIFDNFGVKGDNGNKRIVARYASQPGKEGFKQVAVSISTPPKKHRNSSTNDNVKKPRYAKKVVLEPEDAGDYNFGT